MLDWTFPMHSKLDEDLTTWAERIEATIARTEHCCVDRVVVVAQTASTQDTAAAMAGSGEIGSRLMVLAGVQKSGRGRMGRKWDSGSCGLTATIALADQGMPTEWLSLAGGLSMYLTCHGLLGDQAERLRVKSPNDLVVLEVGGPKRLKLGGVLVERRAGLVLVGFGINVTQQDDDWNAALAKSAISLAQLGCGASRIEVAERLVGAVSRVCAMDQAAVEHELADVLTH
ncbi:MAG: biotin-(acetyl-CoA carboxylase) ligase [Phycisphaerales bacterium]|jgi:biotin-(acetyl-CoA carboxylase) ligase